METNMQTCIIDKLLQWERAYIFYVPLVQAQSDLRHGLLLNPHELEVTLAAYGRVSYEH